MRAREREQLLIELVEETWTGNDEDLGAAVLDGDGAFRALAWNLEDASDGSPDGFAAAWHDLVHGIDDHTLDWLADEADNPAAFLASRVS